MLSPNFILVFFFFSFPKSKNFETSKNNVGWRELRTQEEATTKVLLRLETLLISSYRNLYNPPH